VVIGAKLSYCFAHGKTNPETHWVERGLWASERSGKFGGKKISFTCQKSSSSPIDRLITCSTHGTNAENHSYLRNSEIEKCPLQPGVYSAIVRINESYLEEKLRLWSRKLRLTTVGDPPR
jgi:hypothetical protein